MGLELPTVSELCSMGAENLTKLGIDCRYTGGKLGPSIKANHIYLDSLFFHTRLLDPVDADITVELFGRKLKTPVFCSAISRRPNMPEDSLTEIAKGVASAGSLIMLGIGGSAELQKAVDTGAPVVKIVKPYRRTELIYEKVRDAERCGCLAVGMDIDHFHGNLRDDRVIGTEIYGPQSTDNLRQIIRQSKLPFIMKGVLSVTDAEKALEIGASVILVSSHGSGAFDFALPSMMALPQIVEAVDDRAVVLIDSGFRSGNDVLKALAFGARAVGFATYMLLAWGADGAHGVEYLINLISSELKRTMTSAGCSCLADINGDIIFEMPLTLESK